MALQIGFAGCGLVLIGLIISIVGLIAVQPALRSLRWQPVDGVVTAPAESSSGLRYRYSAGGRNFSGSRVAFHGQVTTSRYQDGQPVTVFVDPAAPDRAVLVPGPGITGYLPLGLGGLFFVVGMILGMIGYVVH
jgi:hypothetical protein